VDQRARRLETGLMDLFRDTRRGDVFEGLYCVASGSLLAWILRLQAQRGSACDPHDLLQDTFVNIYNYGGRFQRRGSSSFRSWARTIAANVVRRGRRRRPTLSIDALPGHVGEPADPRQNPQRDAHLSECTIQLGKAWMLLLLHYAAAYRSLSERDRRALDLVEVQGLSYVAASEVLGVRSSNMKMIIFRSRQRIRARMRDVMLESLECREVLQAS